MTRVYSHTITDVYGNNVKDEFHLPGEIGEIISVQPYINQRFSQNPPDDNKFIDSQTYICGYLSLLVNSNNILTEFPVRISNYLRNYESMYDQETILSAYFLNMIYTLRLAGSFDMQPIDIYQKIAPNSTLRLVWRHYNDTSYYSRNALDGADLSLHIKYKCR